MAPRGPAAAFELAGWRVDPSADEIVRDGEVRKLEPRMMRLLVCLAESAGSVVSTERLLDEVWAGVVVGPASVYQSVSQLRKLLGDSESAERLIETVPRKGYRLVAPVHGIDTSAAAGSATASAQQQRATRRTWLLGAAALAVALIVFAYLRIERSSVVVSAPPSIAVLPFVDMTTDQKDQPFCDGLSEELSNWLAQVPTLRVVARTSAFSYRGRNVDVRQIGKELLATHLLEGSVRRSGDNIRVTAQLIDTTTGYHLWSTSIDRPFTDVIRVQDEIAQAVATALEIRLTPAIGSQLAARRATDSRAYELYLLARDHQNRRTPRDNKEALTLYQQSLAEDPGYALAYVGRAFTLLNEAYFSGRRIDDLALEIEPLIARALALNPQLPDAYAARGALRGEQFRLREAQADLEHALKLNANDARSYAELGRVMRRLGEPRRTLDAYAQAAALDPRDYLMQAEHCVALQDVGQYQQAALACERARALDTGGSWGNTVTAWLAVQQGRLDEAIRWTELAAARSPEDQNLIESLAGYEMQLGLAREARARLEQLSASENRNAALGDAILLTDGAAALRAFLATSGLERSSDAEVLLATSRLRLLTGEFEAASKLAERAIASPYFDAASLLDPWWVRTGYMGANYLACAELEAGVAERGRARLAEVAKLLDRLERDGQAGFGLHVARAEVLALQGDPDGAMRSLELAVERGWRGAVWARHEPQYASLRARADYRALIQRTEETNALMRASVLEARQRPSPGG